MAADNRTIFSVKTEAVIFAILAGLALFLRVNQLSADPPFNLSYSTAAFTDPAQYISFARNLVLWGDLNPLRDFRLVFFLKSSTTLLSYLVFSLIGTGYIQANIVGLLFSYSTIILYYFALRRLAGNAAALVFLFFIAFDFNQVFFGRYPFLENSMNIFAALSFFLLIRPGKIVTPVLSGLFLAVGIFFGKMIGLVYLAPVLCFAVYEYFHDYRKQLKPFIRKYAAFTAAFLALLVFWYFYSYRPMTASVEGYLQEQALGLYGMPKALMSVDYFLYKYLSFGATSRLFERMVVPAMLCWGVIAVFFFRGTTVDGWKNRLGGINPGILFMIVLVLASFGALMIWNYRPLRYTTMMIYPICALAGYAVSRIIRSKRMTFPSRTPILFPVLLVAWVSIPVFQLLAEATEASSKFNAYNDYGTAVLVISVIITVGFILFGHVFRGGSLILPSVLKYIIIVPVLLGAVMPGIIRYAGWSATASYCSRSASKDLESIVSPEAVISGPYAARLTQDTRLRNLIHMFGVANVDTAFFRRYPITHLLLDASNEEYARENYPDILEKAPLIAEYRITNRIVRLYRVAGFTGNVRADHYHMSDFEMVRLYKAREDYDSTALYMNHYLKLHQENSTANLVVAIDAAKRGEMKVAEQFLRRAVEFSPTDFHLRYKLGELYIRWFGKTNNIEYYTQGVEQLNLARKYNPTSNVLVNKVDQLLKREDTSGIE